MSANSANANRFDARAATWDEDPKKHRRAAAVAEAVRAAVTLQPDMRLLEYGAGTGLLAQALADDVGDLTVADSSAGMLAVLRDKVAGGALPRAEVWDLDLSRDAAPAGERFDVVVTAMALHHIPDLPPVLSSFASLLRPGGHLCVADLEAEDGSFHGPGFEGHDGIARDLLSSLLTDAGFADVRFQHCYRMNKDGRDYDLFLATAQRAATSV